MADGLVHVRSLGDDYYEYDAERFMLVGSDHGHTYRLGGRLRVKLINVSIAEGRIDFEIASGDTA